MTIGSFWKRYLLGLFFLALLTGCAKSLPETSASEPAATLVSPTSSPIPPTPTLHPVFLAIKQTNEAKPTSCEEIDGICLDLTFDGENCTYEGPLEISPGHVGLIFNNQSEGPAVVNFLKLLEGKTIEDVIEYNGEEPSTKHHPSWSRELGTYQSTDPGESHFWAGELEPGDYFMVCARLSPLGVWLGTGLTVR